MDFALTADQQLVRDSARALLEKECPTSLVRTHMNDPRAYAPSNWSCEGGHAAASARRFDGAALWARGCIERAPSSAITYSCQPVRPNSSCPGS